MTAGFTTAFLTKTPEQARCGSYAKRLVKAAKPNFKRDALRVYFCLMSKELERGDIFFFYRPKVDAEEASEVQRLYMVLSNSSVYRLLIVGANELPAEGDGSDSSTRRWALVRAVAENSAEIEDFLKGGEYETETKGSRHLPPVAPVGEGRYALIDTGDSTQLVYRLRRPKKGDLAETLGLREEASYVVSVKNPSVKAKGFPEDQPDYPDQLAGLFQNRRWIPVLNSGLLNYPDAQLLLIGAHGDDAAKELGVKLNADSADLRSAINLDLPEEGLLKSRFPELTEFEKRHHEEIETDFGAGGKTGGKKSARSSDSATGVATLLAGLDFPAAKKAVLQTARANRTRSESADAALRRLERLPRREFSDMAQLQEALSQATTQDEYPCEICGKKFDNESGYRSHLDTSHPEQAVSAADIESALSGADYPADRDELAGYAEKKGDDERIPETIRELPDRTYRDAADVAVGFQESITGREHGSEKPPSRKSLESASAAALAKALDGIDLPASPDEIKKHAEKARADQAILEAIGSLPDRSYQDVAEIEKGFSEATSRNA